MLVPAGIVARAEGRMGRRGWRTLGGLRVGAQGVQVAGVSDTWVTWVSKWTLKCFQWVSGVQIPSEVLGPKWEKLCSRKTEIVFLGRKSWW